MKTFYAILLTSIFVLAGCNGDKVNLSSLTPAATRTVGKLTIVLLNKNGELMQGQTNSSSSSRVTRASPPMSAMFNSAPTCPCQA